MDDSAKRHYRTLAPREVRSDERELAYEVLVGLSEKPKRLPSKLFYDDEGSRLFQRIMSLPEYYLTDCEREILLAHSSSIVDVVAEDSVNVVDLGAGDGEKTMILLEHLARRSVEHRFVPIDISEGAMQTLIETVRRRLPNLDVDGLIAEYSDGLEHLATSDSGHRNLVLFLGSNIGNFDRARSRAFLRRLWSAMNPGDLLLIGFDLKKDIDVLLRAYNDRQGVTAAFNLNLLTRLNATLGAHFDVEKFRHFGTYDVFSGAMQSYLVSLERQRVEITGLNLAFQFEAWEPIHTEYSYKYLRTDVTTLASDTGFSIQAEFLDEKRWFLNSLWQAEKNRPALG